MKSFAAVFGHPESHGPQICAIHMIANHSTQVDVLFRNVAPTNWQFPANVNMMKDGEFVDQEEVYKKSSIKKLFYFFRFLCKMFFALRRKKYDLIILFDPMSFFAFSLIYRMVPKNLIWYHNYDAIDLNNTRKYSLSWFANNAPFRIFPQIDYFSLPMEERVRLFPVQLLKNKYTIIPNYSMLETHAAKPKKIVGDKLCIVYVGSIGKGHGLEEIIKLPECKIAGKQLQLILKGYIQEEYKTELLKLAEAHNAQRLTILQKGPWKDVPEIIKECHIGIAIYTGKDQMNATLGKGGSGKVYQYIAEGLPVLMNNEFYKNFSDCKWAVPTGLDQESLIKSISKIIDEYEYLSQTAITDFIDDFNCNKYFDSFFKRIASN